MERSRYIVAATPRTGSSLLCECLLETGVAGRPAELFAPAFRGLWRKHLAVSPEATFDDYLREARRYGTTSNGVYALKIQWMHVGTLASEIGFQGPSDGVLESLFPGASFVNIVRRDRRAQAISWYRAIETSEWWRFSGDLRIKKRPVLDVNSVLRLEEDIERQQLSWERYFRDRSITPLTVEYELLAGDYRAQTERVLRFLGLDFTTARSLPVPLLVRQSDDLNARWRERIELAPSWEGSAE